MQQTTPSLAEPLFQELIPGSSGFGGKILTLSLFIVLCFATYLKPGPCIYTGSAKRRAASTNLASQVTKRVQDIGVSGLSKKSQLSNLAGHWFQQTSQGGKGSVDKSAFDFEAPPYSSNLAVRVERQAQAVGLSGGLQKPSKLAPLDQRLPKALHSGKGSVDKVAFDPQGEPDSGNLASQVVRHAQAAGVSRGLQKSSRPSKLAQLQAAGVSGALRKPALQKPSQLSAHVPLDQQLPQTSQGRQGSFDKVASQFVKQTKATGVSRAPRMQSQPSALVPLNQRLPQISRGSQGQFVFSRIALNSRAQLHSGNLANEVLKQAQVAGAGGGRTTKTIDSPPEILGKSTGKGGEKGKGVMHQNDAKIHINQNFPEGVPHKIVISGPESNVEVDAKLIGDTMGKILQKGLTQPSNLAHQGLPQASKGGQGSFDNKASESEALISEIFKFRRISSASASSSKKAAVVSERILLKPVIRLSKPNVLLGKDTGQERQPKQMSAGKLLSSPSSLTSSSIKRPTSALGAQKNLLDPEGREFDFTRVVVNIINVGVTYGVRVLGKDPTHHNTFHWEGVRKCVQHLREELNLFVIGIVWENFNALGSAPDEKAVPYDIRNMMETIILVPRITGSHHKQADDEITIKVAHRRNCRFLDNDNYRDWLVSMQGTKTGIWLQQCQELLQMRYFFDTGTGDFDTLDGNVAAVKTKENPAEIRKMPPQSLPNLLQQSRDAFLDAAPKNTQGALLQSPGSRPAVSGNLSKPWQILKSIAKRPKRVPKKFVWVRRRSREQDGGRGQGSKLQKLG